MLPLSFCSNVTQEGNPPGIGESKHRPLRCAKALLPKRSSNCNPNAIVFGGQVSLPEGYWEHLPLYLYTAANVNAAIGDRFEELAPELTGQELCEEWLSEQMVQNTVILMLKACMFPFA